MRDFYTIAFLIFSIHAFAQFEAPIEIPDFDGVEVNWLVTPIDTALKSANHNGNSHLRPFFGPDIFIRNNTLHQAITSLGQPGLVQDYDGMLYVSYDAIDGTVKSSIPHPYQKGGRQQRPLAISYNETSASINITSFRNLEPIDSSRTSFFGANYQFSTQQVADNALVDYFGNEEDSTIVTQFFPGFSNPISRTSVAGLTEGEETVLQNYHVDINSMPPRPCLVYHRLNRNTGKIASSADTICMDHEVESNVILSGGQFGFQWNSDETTKGFFFYAYDINNPEDKKFEVGQLDRNYNEVGSRVDLTDAFLDPSEFTFRFTSQGDLFTVFRNQSVGADRGIIIHWVDKSGTVVRQSGIVNDPNGQSYSLSNGYSAIKLYDDEMEQLRYFVVFRSPDRNKLDFLEIEASGETSLYRQLVVDPENDQFVFASLSNVSAVNMDSVFIGFSLLKRGPDGFFGDWAYLMSFSLRDTTTQNNEALRQERFAVYPSPFSEQLTFDFPVSDQDYQVVLTNTLGQTVAQRRLSQQNNQMSTAHLQPGAYYYRIKKDGQWLSSGQVMKQ